MNVAGILSRVEADVGRRVVPAGEVLLDLLLAQSTATTRPQLVAWSKLSAPTVGQSMERLVRLGLVAEVGQRSGDLGRSPALYEVSAGAGLLAAMDLGGNNVRVALTDARGLVLAEGQEPSQVDDGGVLDQATTLAHRLRAQLDRTSPFRGSPFACAGVSLPGVVDPQTRLLHYAWNIGATGPVDAAGQLERSLGAPVVVDNNVNLAALGEQWQGATREVPTFAVVSVGAGMGAGIVHDGRLLHGVHGAAGEVSFLPLSAGFHRSRPLSPDEGGGITLLTRARRRKDWGSKGAPGSVQDLFERARAGHRGALRLVREESERVALVIASIAALVDPGVVVLAGGVGSNPHLVELVEDRLAELAPYPPTIIPAALGERASLVGAIRLATQEMRPRLLRALQETSA
jgi:predicted NBD/HSP70 family sugar kinase